VCVCVCVGKEWLDIEKQYRKVRRGESGAYGLGTVIVNLYPYASNILHTVAAKPVSYVLPYL